VSRRFLASSLAALALAATILGDPLAAWAAPNDKEIEALVESVMTTDYAAGKFDDALTQLEFGKQACAAKASCSAKVRGKLFIAIGTVLAGGQKKVAEAKEAFATALREDPTANLIGDLQTPEIQAAFNQARGGGTASGGTAETKKGPATRAPKKTYPGNLRPGRGWRNAEAWFYYEEAARSEASRDWLDCADYAQASLAAENRQTTRYLAAACEERAGLWVEALADFQTVFEAAGKLGIRDIESKSKKHLDNLREKIPKIVIRKPARADDLVVRLNDVEIAPEKLNGEIWVNPGQRTITAKGNVDGVPMEFEQAVDASESETNTVEIKLGPKGVKKDQVMMRCMLAAQTRDDFAKCLNTGATSSLNLHLGLEVSGYHDTEHVDVVTPAFVASVESPTGGWGVHGSMLVDVVTAASADIVANASPRWREARYVPTLGGHKKFGDVDLSLNGTISREPDYLATGAGAGVSVDLRQKTITPALNYEFSYDVSGRAGTPFSVFSHQIVRHGIAASTTFVLDKATLFAVNFTAVLESGDTSKPYRYIPMFDAQTAARVPIGLAIESVNQNRLSIRVLEQLPTSRQRWALAGMVAHRFTSSTLRVEERLYVDNWGLKASTTDGQFLMDLAERVRVWPAVRANVQTAVNFWQLAYTAKQGKTGADFSVPSLRTGDRELGPLVGVTFGAGGRFALGEHKNWALGVTGNINYTRFLDHLYLIDRLAYYGATTLEVDFE
jgi:tetratricopeptide (TPR) repeat protein